MPVVNAPGYQVDVMEDAMLSALSSDFSKFGSDNVVNYLYMRLILDSAQYLPSYQTGYDLMPKVSWSFDLFVCLVAVHYSQTWKGSV